MVMPMCINIHTHIHSLTTSSGMAPAVHKTKRHVATTAGKGRAERKHGPCGAASLDPTSLALTLMHGHACPSTSQVLYEGMWSRLMASERVLLEKEAPHPSHP